MTRCLSLAIAILVVLVGCGDGSKLDTAVHEDDIGGELPINSLIVGDCFDEPLEGPFSEDKPVAKVPVVSCEGPHLSEVYFIGALAEDEFPGWLKVKKMVDLACIEQFSAYVGTEFAASELDIHHIYPSKKNWQLEDRTFTCALYRQDGEKLRGSSKTD